MIPLQSEPLPIEATATAVLVVSLVVAILWLRSVAR